MAIINFSRMKVHAVTRWLWLALSGGMFVAAPAGCEKDCNCQCECAQPAACLTAPIDRTDAVAGSATGQDATQAATDSGAAGADAMAVRAKGAGDVANPATTPTPTEAVTTSKTRKKPADPPKEPERIVVPDVPQVAYGPPPVIDPGHEIQPLYGVPIDRDRMPQIMYRPPSNMGLKNSD